MSGLIKYIGHSMQPAKFTLNTHTHTNTQCQATTNIKMITNNIWICYSCSSSTFSLSMFFSRQIISICCVWRKKNNFMLSMFNMFSFSAVLRDILLPSHKNRSNRTQNFLSDWTHHINDFSIIRCFLCAQSLQSKIDLFAQNDYLCLNKQLTMQFSIGWKL